MLFTPGYPGFLRGLAPAGPASSWSPPRAARSPATGPATAKPIIWQTDSTSSTASPSAPATASCSPNSARAACTRCGRATSNVLASGLHDPVGVAFGSDGVPLVAESGAGRVVRLAGVDRDRRRRTAAPAGHPCRATVSSTSSTPAPRRSSRSTWPAVSAHTIAAGLPVGPPPGVEPKPLKGMPPFSGPQGPFAGITAGPDGTLYVSADGDGSVLALRRT